MLLPFQARVSYSTHKNHWNIEAHQDTPPLSAMICGAFRQVGLVNGPAILCNINTGPVSASDVPNLQANTQLFIKTNLGIPATSVGPLGNMSIARRVVLDAHLFWAVCGPSHHFLGLDSYPRPHNNFINHNATVWVWWQSCRPSRPAMVCLCHYF